ncbi:MAG: PilC/PilY family type IV pilus protein, partial [Gammaproteobacteria bacterium]|nr:PilC/PilY family type IV pilus protein [Gammaproteobacteria bacterium]
AVTPQALEATTTVASMLNGDLVATSTGDCTAADTDDTSACNLIKYIRGVSNDATDSETDGSKNRNWLVGDALHSRPLTLNYGAANGYSTSIPDIRIFVGTNDGFLRMIRNKTTSGAEEGVEGWAYMPREVMGMVKELKTGTWTTEKHPFGVDGEPVSYVVDNDADGNIESPDETGKYDKVYLYFGLRRGGKSYTALDITDPDDPKFIWKISKTSGGDFDELGQTWSTPRVRSMVYGGSTTPRPVLIFGGGYDTNKDDHSSWHSAAPGGKDSEGTAIYIVNALTGALVWKAAYDASVTTPGYDSASKTYKRNDMFDSIPSSITVADPNGNDLPDRLYVGDTGGVLWRVDTLSNDESNWIVNPLLSVGARMTKNTPTLPKDDRRFFYPPDYVQAKDSISGDSYDAVVIGTGDRSEPLATDTEEWFYVVRDRDLISGTLTNLTANGPIEHYDDATDGSTTPPNYGLVDVSQGSCILAGTCTASYTYGWKMKLDCPNDSGRTFAGGNCGEKNLSASFTIGGTIFMTSYLPPDTTSTNCGPEEGTGLLYELSLQDGSAVNDNDGDGVITANDRFSALRSGGIPAEVVSLGGDKVLAPDLTVKEPEVKGGFRTYWHASDED